MSNFIEKWKTNKSDCYEVQVTKYQNVVQTDTTTGVPWLFPLLWVIRQGELDWPQSMVVREMGWWEFPLDSSGRQPWTLWLVIKSPFSNISPKHKSWYGTVLGARAQVCLISYVWCTKYSKWHQMNTVWYLGPPEVSPQLTILYLTLYLQNSFPGGCIQIFFILSQHLRDIFGVCVFLTQIWKRDGDENGNRTGSNFCGVTGQTSSSSQKHAHI